MVLLKKTLGETVAAKCSILYVWLHHSSKFRLIWCKVDGTITESYQLAAPSLSSANIRLLMTRNMTLL